MFSETRYARNGDLRVAYRASREGPRDIVFVPNWFTNCEVVPELPSIQGWIEAMTSLGRLIFEEIRASEEFASFIESGYSHIICATLKVEVDGLQNMVGSVWRRAGRLP
jgi:hypothetical protein